MIEKVYRSKDKAGSGEKKLPRNVRQIGEAGKGKKVYLEDYAVTYLHQVEAAVLLGEAWEKDGVQYLFIHGAVQVEDNSFGEDVWEKVYREAKEYFPDSEILGWSMQVPEMPEAPDREAERIHRVNFDREDTVLLLYEPVEKEDAVFVSEGGKLVKCSGYYVYYDKNKSMQDYMVCRNEGKSVEKEAEVPDSAIKSFRRRTAEKKKAAESEKEPPAQPKNVRFLYAASTFLALTILVIGFTMVNNYDKMKKMELALSGLNGGTEALAVSADPETETQSETESESGDDEEAQETESLEGSPDAGETDAAKETETQNGQESESDGRAGTSQAEGNQAQASAAENPSVTNDGSQAANTPQSGADQASQAQQETEAQQASAPAVRQYQASYTVKFGDTLVDICRMYYGTDEKMQEICDFNGITDPNRIVPGQTIKLP